LFQAFSFTGSIDSRAVVGLEGLIDPAEEGEGVAELVPGGAVVRIEL